LFPSSAKKIRLGGIWTALALGLLLRLGFAWYAERWAPLVTNLDGYEALAMSLLERGEYGFLPGQPSALRDPGYPLFIAAVYGLTGGRHPWAVIGLQCLLSLATAALVWLLARRLFSERVGLFCGWVYAFYPSAIYYSVYFFRETWIAFWVAALVWLSASWSKEPRSADRRNVWISGICAAVLALSNSALLPAVALAGLALWLVSPELGRLRRVLIYFAPLVAATCIWTVRNRAAFGVFIPGSTHGGTEIYQALIVPPEDLGTERQTRIIAADPVLQAMRDLPETQSNAFLLRASGEFVIRHPGIYAKRVCSRLVKFWRLFPYERKYNVPYPAVVLAAV
jgi:4-amino-4-deoxy-L-arabinose transferase-like glycosyltransferase